MSANSKLTPLMKQYLQIREAYPDAILLFQVGDFYELFFDDAIKASSFLGIALTKRGKHQGKDIPLCGVPVHALKHYVTKLVKGGFKVALCDQLSAPKPGTVVERGVTQVFTPGTLTDESMLDTKAASYLLSLHPYEDKVGLVFGELLTAQLFATTVLADSLRGLESELHRFFPDEIIVPDTKEAASFSRHVQKLGFLVSVAPQRAEHEDESHVWIEKQFDDSTRATLHKQPSILQTVRLLYHYLERTQKNSLNQLNAISFYQPYDYLFLDAATQRNLEIIKNNNDASSSNTLFAVVDHAQTSMGSRTLRKWLTRPLLHHKAIVQRQEVVGLIASNVSRMQKLQQSLCQLADLERIVGRIALRRALAHDYCALKNSLCIIPTLKKYVSEMSSSSLALALADKFFDYSSIVDLLDKSIEEGGGPHIIKNGFDDELDRLRDLVEHAQQAIIKLESHEIQRTGIESLKIRYNKITGYAIEVTKPNLSKVPDDYMRQQTLTNRERFVTQELLDLQRDINRAHNEIAGVEADVYEKVKLKIEERLADLRKTAYALSYLDALYGFAQCAYENNYCKPEFNESRDVRITGGRHPVVEQKVQGQFVANDSALTDDQSLWIITGPNMGGKSTYLRQVAHMCLLAQCGSFVPATAASLPIVDRIFTRIGAGDNVAEGKSTFLVEMEETAVICSSATQKSLVILDEVGRGTSTFDGLAIAHAVIEYIHSVIGSRCLFATHYHELTKLPDEHPGIVNYHMVSKKTHDGIAFVHRIEPGTSRGSFGIDVARLAQLPPQIVSRARTLLAELEAASSHHHGTTFDPATIDSSDAVRDLQHALEKKEELLEVIRSINCDELSPRGALDLLWDLKSKL